MEFYARIRIRFKDAQSSSDFGKHAAKLMIAFRKQGERIQCSYGGGDGHHLAVSFKKVLPDDAAINVWIWLMVPEVFDVLGPIRAQLAPKGLSIGKPVDQEQASQRSPASDGADFDPARLDEIILANAEVFQLEQQGKFLEALPAARCTARLALSCSATHYCPGTMEALLNLAGILFVVRDYGAADLVFENTLTMLCAIKDRGVSDVPTNWHEWAASLKVTGATITLVNKDGSADEPGVVPASDSRTAGYASWGAKINPTYADHLSNYAVFFQSINHYAVAEQLLLQVIDSDRNLGRWWALAVSLGHLATLYQEMGKLSAAEPLLTEALGLKLESIGENHPSFANTLTRLAQVHSSLYNMDKAERYARKALRIRQKALPEDHPQVAQSLCELGLLLSYDMEQLDEAEQCLVKSVDIRRRTLGENDPALALSLSNLARVWIRRGRLADTEALLEEATSIWRIARGQRDPIYTVAINGLALLQVKKGNYAVAEELMRQALTTRQLVGGEQHPSTAVILSNLAVLCTVTNRIDEAYTLLKQTSTIRDNTLEQVLPVLSENEQLNYLGIMYETLSSFLSFMFEYLPHNRDAIQTALSLVLRSKGISAEALAVQHNAVLSGRYPTLESTFRQIESLRAQIGQRILWGSKVADSDTQKQTINTLASRKEALEKELARQIPGILVNRQFADTDWRSIAHALPQSYALVEFVRYTPTDFELVYAFEAAPNPPRYMAFVLLGRDPDEVHALDLGEALAIDQLIDDLRFLIENSDLKQIKPVEEEYALRQMVFDPFEDLLQDCSHIFLAPDGDLNRLPFEVLPIDEERRLIDEYQISYLGTGRDLLRFGVVVDGQSCQSLVIADPDFDLCIESPSTHGKSGSRGTVGTRAHPHGEQREPPRRSSNLLEQLSFSGGFERLEGSQVEGEQIAAMLQVPALLGKEALEKRVKSCRSPRILHIATHGFFLSSQASSPGADLFHNEPVDSLAVGRISPKKGTGPPVNPMLRSGLVLAGVNSWLKDAPLAPEAEDGLLTAEDVMGMDLLNTELVVLSACDTGLGAVQTGEGVLGLRRSFVVAGARSLVMSLWKVPDQQTQALMVDFYSRILSGQPCAQALREAQLSLKKKFPHLKYWGGFIYQGDPGPLSQ